MTDAGNIGRLVRGRLWFDGGFSQVPNSWIRDKRLTFTARGVLIWIVSHDTEFEVTIRGIAAGTQHGVDAIRTAVGELERTGYLKRYRRRERGRIVGTDWELCDPFAPVDNNGQVPLDLEQLNPLGKKKPRSAPEREKPDVVQPDVVQPAVVDPTTKEDQLKEHLTNLPEVTTEAPVDNSPSSARVQSESGAQSATSSGSAFDLAASLRSAGRVERPTVCRGRRGIQPHIFADLQGNPHYRCRECGEERPDEMIVDPRTGEVA